MSARGRAGSGVPLQPRHGCAGCHRGPSRRYGSSLVCIMACYRSRQQ
jgi:hypothetical protein